jgi:hypothetical protein
MIIFMATTLAEVSSPLALGQWQLDQISDLSERGSSTEDIAVQLNLDPILAHEVIEIRYQIYNKAGRLN